MRRRIAVGLVLASALVSLLALSGSATAYPVQYCSQIPIVGGIPPWGFHTGEPISGANGSYARGHGNINLNTNRVSGILCEVDRTAGHDRLILMRVLPHLVYHSHFSHMWGFPGNIMKINVRVTSSNDPACKVGTEGHATLYASYNGVRSDSVQFFFPVSSCHNHDHLYHGTQVNNQVPPL